MNTVSAGNIIHASDLDQVINWLLGTTISDSTVTAVPVGALVGFAGSAAPAGWLLCDGSAVSRTTYASLFSAIGTTYGAGDGSTTFNVPDLRGRVPVGAGTGSGLSTRTRGGSGGEEGHTLGSAENGQHSHGGSTLAESAVHTHGVTLPTTGAYGFGASLVTAGTGSSTGNLGYTSAAENPAHAHTISNDPAAATNAHNTMQPYGVVNFIVKA